MNLNWQTFLTRHGAVIAANKVEHFGDAAGELGATAQDTVLCDLSQFGMLKVSGEEAQSFLHNLFSSDVNALTPQHALRSSFNTAKGRTLATFLIWRTGADYFLQLPQELTATIQKKLSMYVLRAKVKIEDASDSVVRIGISGANAEKLLKEHICVHLEKTPLSVSAGTHDNKTCFSVIRLDEQRFQVNIDPPEDASALWQKLSTEARPVGSPCWNWLNIRAGIPVVLPQTQEQFVAQMMNLDLIGAVNFKKGCYPGQEIVARMQYLGKLKRRMYLAHLDSTDNPQPGDELFSAEMEGQASGMIVNAAPAPSGGYDVLAVVQISSRDTQTLHWKSLQGAALQFLPLPYPLPQS